jgi:hypothetical protein
MNAQYNTAPKGLRGWWRTPPRSGARLLINPIEYRHLRVYGIMRIVGGSFLTFGGMMCLAYHAYGWAALFLVLAALNLAGGAWFVNLANSEPSRT